MTTEATTYAEIEALLTADHLTVSYGVRVLDSDDVVIEDMSDYVVGGTIEYHRDATIHRSATLELSQERDWENERFQPYQTWTSDTYYKTWYQGVFIPTAPDVDYGDDPITYRVECLDKISLLDVPIGDTYEVASGTGYLAAVRQALSDSGVTGVGYEAEGDSESETLSEAMVWFLSPTSPETWKTVCDDLLAAVGHGPIYADTSGLLRSDLLVDHGTRGSSWEFDLADDDTTVVLPPRTEQRNEQDKTNQYRFVRKGMSTQPSEGAGYVTVGVGDGHSGAGGTVTMDGTDFVHSFTSSGTFTWYGADTEVEFMLLGGGGGGGGALVGAGGGGGGGEHYGGVYVVSAGEYTVTVGAGGAGGGTDAQYGIQGGSTSCFGFTAVGGGIGGTEVYNGVDGGCGGGGGAKNGSTNSGGSATGDHDGEDGGDGDGTNEGVGGGGGGSYAAGANAGSGSGGAGGAGVVSDISGTSLNYAGGGGGGARNAEAGSAGAGGVGGGGNGGKGADGTNGTDGFGGGGGGGGREGAPAYVSHVGGDGGDGVVILRYASPSPLRRKVAYVNAIDQTMLEQIATASVANWMDGNRTMKVQARPWPIGLHNDVVTYTDADADIDGRAAVTSWRLDLASGEVGIDLDVVDDGY